MRAVVHSGWGATADKERDQSDLGEAVAAAVTDPRRVAAVRRLVPLYRPPSDRFDRLTRLAAHLLGAPVALLTLVDADREFYVSSFGLDDQARLARETPIENSMCKKVVATGRPVIVPDFSATTDLVDHPCAKDFGVRSFAAMPLVSSDRWAVGTLCVIDFVPRDWTDDQLANLDMLASICMDEISFSCLDRQSELNRRWGSSVGSHDSLSRAN